MALLSTSEGKAAIGGFTSSSTADDTLIDALIAGIGVAFAQWCRFPRTAAGTWTLESATYTLYLMGDGSDRLRLGVRPLVSVTSIYDDTARAYGASTLVASSDYSGGVDLDTGCVWLLPTGSKVLWSNGIPRAIKATVVAGVSTVDEGLKEAARSTLRAIWTRRKLGETTESVSAQGSSVSVAPSDIPKAAQLLLAARRLAVM